jgi:hypothetical protein
MLVTMDTPSTSANDPSNSTSPGPARTAASFARHDVDVDAPDDARGGHEQATFDRHDVEPNAPDEVVETEEATFDRHDVNVDSADSVNEEDEATFDRHDR